jgi:hypothetical protein
MVNIFRMILYIESQRKLKLTEYTKYSYMVEFWINHTLRNIVSVLTGQLQALPSCNILLI